MEAITNPGLLLKVTPPKLRKTLLVRERLRRFGAAAADTAVLVVEAPAGYGKTSLLAQWRLDWLQQGAAVAWLNLDAGDSPITLVSGIVLGLRRSMARPDFGLDAIEAVRRGAGTAAAITSLLAEITEASLPMVLVFDNGERIGAAEAVEVVDYLLHNLPPNLRVVIGTRPPARAGTLDLLGQGLLRRVTAADLSFDLTETIHLLTARFNGRIDADLCARLHEITGGWPLGLQLAAAALERAADPRRAIDEFSKSHDDATQHLFASLIESLPGGLSGFLTRCALLDALHPSLCEAVTGEDDAGLSLQRLVVETPLLSATEDAEWLRLHPLAREYLRSRAAELPEREQREIHVRAWHWLAEHGFPERAAQHALAAGFSVDALELISASLDHEYDQGHHGNVTEWLARMPRDVIESSHRLRLVALWMHVLDHRFDDAYRDATALIEDPKADGEVRAEAMAALASAFAVADRQDEVKRYLALGDAAAPGWRARQVLTLLKVDFACNGGKPELARRLLVPADDEGVTPAIQIWRDYFTVWSYLWEGRPILAEQVGRYQHARWAVEVGRRGLRAATLGSLLAAAYWQQDLRSDSKALLANRVDVIERASGYAGLINAYLTLTRMAESEGDEARAFAYLEALASIGESRSTVRLVVTSLAERIRLHAARQRPAQAAGLLAELTALVDRSSMSELLAPQIRLDLELAGVFAAWAAGDLAGAHVHVDRARELATELNRGYEAVQVLALRAMLAERAGETPVVFLIEALSRAESGNLVRVFADTLPEVVDLVRRCFQGTSSVPVSRVFIERVLGAAEAVPDNEKQSEPPAGGSALLTPKESAVLRLLAGGLPNKRIATEMELSSETVKWHVKKLLAKLNAGSREHAVHRARMLGLLD